MGSILLAVEIVEKMVYLVVDDVLYVRKAGCNFFSPGLALKEGFRMTWDDAMRLVGS